MFLAILKNYFKNRIYISIYLIWLIGSVLYLFLHFRGEEGLLFSSLFFSTMVLIQNGFFIMLFLSYEWFVRSRRCGIDEIERAYGKGIGGCEFRKFGVCVLQSLILTSAMLFYTLFFWIRDFELKPEYLLFIIKVFILYHFLNYILASLLGWMISKINNRIIGYSALLGTAFLFSSYGVGMLNSISYKTNAFNRIAELFTTFAHDYMLDQKLYYPVSVELVDWEKIFFWILFSITGIVLITANNKLKNSAVLLIFTVCMFGLYIQPSGALYDDLRVSGYDTWTEDMNYYEYNHPVDASIYTDGDFIVNQYVMDLKPERELSADVWASVNQSQENYQFTLYHGYRLLLLEDQDGNELNWSRDGDYISVSNTKGNKISKIHFIYKGERKKYYATKQGICLTAFSYYYPVPGFREVYHLNETDVYKGTSLDCPETQSEFMITIHSDYPVFSNLNNDGHNYLTGTQDGATLVAGLFVTEITVGNNSIITSSLFKYRLRDEEYLKDMKAVDDYIDEKTIIELPNNNEQPVYFARDYIAGELYLVNSRYESFIKDQCIYEKIEEDTYD